MILKQTFSAIAPGIKSSFQAYSGVTPYSYAVTSGPGSVNASTGLYTAPSVISKTDPTVATVTATDANGDTASASIMVGSPLILLCDIIMREMGLSSDQIFLWNQKWTLPNDFRPYVSIAMMTPKAFGSSSIFDPDLNVEVQSVNMSAAIDIRIMSRSLEAVERKEEIAMALKSMYAQRQMAANSFYVSPLPMPMANLSEVDGAAIPYQFTVPCAIQYFVKKVKSAQYFDKFEDVEVEIEP